MAFLYQQSNKEVLGKLKGKWKSLQKLGGRMMKLKHVRKSLVRTEKETSNGRRKLF